jgi:hypothetical protein
MEAIMIASKTLLIGAAAAMAAAAWAAPALAQSPGYCDGMARSAADRQAGPTGVIGSFVGTIDAGYGYQGRWNAAYDAAYESCVQTSLDAATAPEPYVDAPDTVVVTRPAAPRTVVVQAPQPRTRTVVVQEPQPSTRTVVVTRPEPWSAAWYSYCSDRYRSFDPRTGTFTSYSGETVFCQ